MQTTASPCMNCGEGGHPVGKCPVLRAPLKDGFYSGGGGGGGGHNHDDDERAQKCDGAVAPVAGVLHNERRMCNMLDSYIWRYGGRDTRV
jgi:hypothetical protein